MPLNPTYLKKKKKTEEEKEQSYTKSFNNVSLPKKKSYTPVMTDAKRAAQSIKNDTEKKVDTSRHDEKYGSVTKGRTISKEESYRAKTEGRQNAIDSYNNRFGLNTKEIRHAAPSAEQKPKGAGNRPQWSVDREPTRPHERQMTEERANEMAWQLSTNAGAKFIGNAVFSALDYSPIGAAHTLLTGNTIRDNAIQNAPYGQYFGEGLSAGAGRFAGMGLSYGMMRSALNPQLEKATDAVMNGTKLGNTIKNSSILGKIGQKVGTNAAGDIGRGLVKESISDATLGFGQNAIINYGQGLRGEDFWKQQAIDTAFDFGLGGAMEGLGIANKIRKAGKQAKAIGNESILDVLETAANRDEYLNNLKNRGMELKTGSFDTENAGKKLREASASKGSAYTDEYRKVLNMTDEEFEAYRRSRLPEFEEPKVKRPEEPKAEPIAEEEVAKEVDIEPEAEELPRSGGFNRPTRGYASAKGRYDAYTGRKKPTEAAENATVKASENVDTTGKLAPQEEMKLEPEKPVKETTTKKKSNKGKKKADQQAEMVLEQKPKETAEPKPKEEVKETKPPTEEQPKTEPAKEQPKVEEPKTETPVKEEAKATERKPHLNMSYSTLISLPDSEAKFLTLERKLMKLQPHGSAFEEGQKEWRRLFETYRGKGAKETATEAATKADLPKAEVKPKGDLPKAEIVSHRVEASDALNELENKGWVFLGKNGSIKKGADGAYTLKSADKTETVLTKEQAEKYVKDTVEEFNANLKVNKDLPKKADLDAKPQVEVEAKPEAKAEAKPEGTYANVRAQVHSNYKKQKILDKMHDAGVNLPEGSEKWTKQELLDYNNGKKAAEDISKKYELQPTRQAKKTEIDLLEYNEIVTNGYRDAKADEVIKDELLKKYKEDYEKLGTPLDNEQIAALEKLNVDDLHKHIQDDGLARSGEKTADEYIDNRIYRKENSKPELVRKSDLEDEALKSEQLRKGRDDAYTREKGEIDLYTGREVQKPKTTSDEVAKMVDDFLKPRFDEGHFPVTPVMAKRLEIPEADIRKYIEESDNYVLDGNQVKPKSAAATVTSAEGEATQTMAGYATTYGTGNKRNKGLPTKLTKEKAENIKTKRFAAMDNADELTKSNKKKPKKIELDASKVDDIKLDAGEARTSIETGAPKEKTLKERAKSLWKKFRRDIIDSTDEFRAMDNATGKTKLQEKYKMSQGSRAQAGHQLVTEITDRKGNALKFKDKDGNDVTKSFREVFKDFEDNMDDVSLYMFNKHEIQRAMQSNKNALSLSIYGYSKDEAAKAANAVVNAYPELKKQKDAIEDWLANGMQNDDAYRAIKGKVDGFDNVIQKLNQIKSEQAQKTVEALEAKYGKDKLDKLSKDWKETYERWFDEWAVKSGLVDKNLTKEWRGKYSNYIPSFRVQDVTSGPMKILDSPDVFHSVKGKTDAKLLSVEDQVGIMINRVTSAARRNELNLSILRAIQENPNKGWGKVISVEDDLIGDIDEALKTVASSSGDIINGSKKLTVLADGKKITMEISDELAATLRAMQDGADTGIMTRLGKFFTNPIKLGITGANPTFVVSNAVRDMATALIQSEHGMGKTITGWTKALRGMTGTNKEYAELLKRYKFAGGEMAGYYVQGKGFDTSAILQQKGIKGVLNKVGQVITFLGEQGETIPRFGEFINTMEKTGDFYKAVRDAAEVTVDFSKHGASDGAKLLDAWTLYLNAGLQGIDKFAKTLKAHPLRTAGRTAATILPPAIALMAINHDNPWYRELSDRTRQNYFCIPRLDGEVDEDGNCKEFIRLPMNREYGAILGAGIDAIWRGIRGEENVTSGFAETLKENFLPNNPITDNVLAPMLINIPSNQDYKGSKILTSSEFDDFKAGKNADLQYDAKTSGTAMKVAELANAVMGDKNIPILKYLKSPKLVDYMLDSYGGYYGQIAQSATEQGVDSAGKIAENILLKPYANKFTADPRYSSQTMDEAWDKIAEYKSDQKRAADEGKEWSEAHAKYNAVNKVMKSIYDSYDAEKEIKNDPTLSEQEKKKLVNELREARLELAKTMDSEAEAAAKEYKESPTYSALNEKVKEKYSYTLKISKENWAKAYKAKSDISDAKEEKTGKGTTAEENRIILLDNGIKTYEQAQSLLGKDTSKEAWEYAVEQHEAGVSYRDLVKEAKNYPNYYALDYKQKQKWNEDIGVDKETWGKAYQAKLEANREKQAKVGRDLTAEEEMILLKDHGIKTLEQAQTIDAGIGKSVMLYGDPEAAWDDMVKAVKSGRTYEEAKADAEADAIKYNNAKERVSTMDIPNKHQSKAASIMVKYDGKTVSQKAYDLYTKMVFVANDNNPDKTKRNDTLDTQEIKSAIEEVNRRYGLTQAQKAYIFANTAPKNWNNPYD